MTEVFVDTFYYLALLNPDDTLHGRALAASRMMRKQQMVFVTTEWVLTELGDALAKPEVRVVFLRALEGINKDPRIIIIHASHELFERGLEFYKSRSDKSWSLTDCTSFIVMRDRHISDVLTGDRHFTQAGFKTLL